MFLSALRHHIYVCTRAHSLTHSLTGITDVFVFILHVDLDSNIIAMLAFSAGAAFLLSKSYDQVATTYKIQFERTLAAGVKSYVHEQASR
jgi:hypothetical protein